MKNKYFMFTCDVEYFGPHTEKGVNSFLELLDAYKIKGTFFVTCQIVNDYPDLVKDIIGHGHEVASHGYSHPVAERTFKFLDSLSDKEVEEEVARSYNKIAGKGFKVEGFRAPAFKISDYALACIRQWFRYDSSQVDFIVRAGRYKRLNEAQVQENNFIRIPVSSIGVMKIPFGSPYFMLLGSSIKRVISRYLADSVIVMFYCHCFDLVQSSHRAITPPRAIRNMIYFNLCGSTRARDFFNALISTSVEKGFTFITCSQFCDILQKDEDNRAGIL
ncbi:MAG: polysaccharide deacetylase family protein [Dissulfurispiraceae bacterium]